LSEPTATLPAQTSGRSLRLADFGLLEALAFLLARQNIATWAKSWAAAAGMALPALPLFQYNYLLFASVLVMLLWVKLRGETWESFGLVNPESWLRVTGLGVLLFVLVVAYSASAAPAISKAVAELTGSGPNLAGQYFASLKGNLPLLLLLLPLTWLFAAFGEEVFFRGYLMTRFAQFMGEGRLAWTIALIAQAAIFGAAHSYQGPAGMVGAGILGLILGAATLLWRRNLWPAIISHGLTDTLGFTLLYLGHYGDGG
jgi:membrane protease YdiL (CAAX protease family)